MTRIVPKQTAEGEHGEGGAIIANQAAIDAVYNEHFTEPTTAAGPEAEPDDNGNPPTAEMLPDTVLLDMARNAANGDKFSRLNDGDYSGYSSQSEADLALCLLLAFWTGKDPLAMDRLFRASGLYRPKWDERRGSDTYGSATIRLAVQQTTETFKPKQSLPRRAGQNNKKNSSEYYVGRTGLFWNKVTKDGLVPVRLTNFIVKIVREVRHFDGIETRIMFEMTAKLRGQELAFQLPACRFAAMSWTTETLGAMAIIEPSQGLRDRARVAIQAVSGNVQRSECFIFSGWHKLPTGWAYLHAGGALGEAGPVAGIQTDLGQLDAFRLPDPLTGANLTRAVKETLTFFSLLPCGLGWPLLLAPFRANLAEAAPPDWSLYLAGLTGSYKTQLAAIVQSFFGLAMADSSNLPASWASTANALERLAFLAKDAVLTIASTLKDLTHPFFT